MLRRVIKLLFVLILSSVALFATAILSSSAELEMMSGDPDSGRLVTSNSKHTSIPIKGGGYRAKTSNL